MADRYWVLGTGTWDGTSTTNWSASSGGAGGASVPTASDNVFFDANSNVLATAFTVTMATTPRVCNDFTASGLDGTMTLAGTSIGLTVSGSLTFQATNFTRTYTGTTTFNATTTGKTVTANGVAFGGPIIFDGTGGGWTLGSAINAGSNQPITITRGTFSTSVSNYSVTAGSISSSNTNVRTISLNGSTVNLSDGIPLILTTTTNLTFNVGTSQLNFSGADAFLIDTGRTYYNVTFTFPSSFPGIQGSNTFNNLTITGLATLLTKGYFSLSGNQTVNGTFTVSAGTASAYRNMVVSSVFGTTRTITCAAVSLTDVDFKDITIAGAAAPAAGTRIGNCKGNSGITFTTAKTVYFRATGSANWGATGSGSWSATSGGALNSTMFPLAQDTAVFPAATYPASGSTVTINLDYNIGTIDMSLRTSNTMTLATGSNFPFIYGNWINGSGTTLSGTNSIFFQGRTTQQITSAAKTFTQPISIESPGGTVQLLDAMTVATTQDTTLTLGTLDLNDFTLSTGSFASNNSNARVINFGTTGSIVITKSTTSGTSALSMATATNFTFTGTSNITSVMTTARSFIFGIAGATSTNRPNLNLTSGTSIPSFSGSFRNVDFTGSTFTANASTLSCHSFTLASGGTYTSMPITIVGNGTLTYTGKSISTLTINATGITTTLNGDGSQATLTLTNGTLNLAGFTLTNTTRITTATGTKNITFNGGTLVISGANTTAFNNAQPTNFTTTAGTGTGAISMTAATATTFVGGGSTFNCTLNQGGAGDLTITGSNTFSDITNTVQPASVLFTAGTTNTFTSFSLSGTAGNLITIGSVTAASHTLSKASGIVSTSYLSISNSTATGGATWEALTTNGNVNGGNNTGWDFGATIYAAVIDETATATDLILGLTIFYSVLDETATATDEIIGGFLYSLDVAETATATDSPSVAASTFNAPVAETATATDSDVGFILFPASIAETATATDSILGRAAFSSALAETATATDLILGLTIFYSVLDETATATDSVLSRAAFSSVLSETATATDSPSVAASTFNAPVAETATATDSPSVAASTFNAPVTETATATDSVLSFADFYAALAETATATDSVLSFADFYAALAETATATDSVLSFADFYAPVAETATATDSPLVAPSTFNAPVAETVTATDAVSPPGSIYNAPVSETVTISDLVLALFLWNLIDDSQSIAWQNVNSSPGTVWSLLDDSQSVTWQNINSSPGTTWSPIDTDPDTGWSVTPTVN